MQVSYVRRTNRIIYTILKQGIWTNIINYHFIQLCKPPWKVTYMFCGVANYISRSQYYLKYYLISKNLIEF
jgi:hypothetical protein